MTTEMSFSGIPETMLWTLHNRASESRREDPCLRDPEAERIYASIDYDYERSFGSAEPSHAIRSLMFDEYLQEFLAHHPDGIIVNLGEGLETQRFRVKGENSLWLSVDVPEAMAVRERFIKPDEKHKHVACSTLDEAWYDEVPAGRSVYITAQGLLMYFEEGQVRVHLQSLSKRFPGAWHAFDVIPRWLSEKSISETCWQKTVHCRITPAVVRIQFGEQGGE
jgi:O-methyltransferase involved in polyketide biosynthesis